ncbi:hypothetical protein ACFQ64_04530 [Streptomyces sp. NPDC056460]|uniref:hypothetical protein n=1 Tax=Streptomyces sp. NPDC056460 TaxID=3345825 RepID=UPI003677D7EB
MIKPDDEIAFRAPDCGAHSLVLRFGDVLVAGLFEPFALEPLAELTVTYDLPTYQEREAEAKAQIDALAIAHILGGWDLITV